jgi:quinol monooxygenase YgiN
MFLRLLRVKVNPDKFSGLLKRYVEVVIPGLRAADGCLYAGLVQSLEDPTDGMSLTMWRSPADARKYVESGTYQRLVDATREFFAESSEWTLQLSPDLELEYRPAPSDPVVTGYAAELSEPEEQGVVRKHTAPMYLRIVSMHVHPDKYDEFVRAFQNEVVPGLRKVDGCQNAYLAAGEKETGEALSITIWDTLQHARVYELSGDFDRLKDKIKHTFSHLAQWKMGLEESTPIGAEEGAARAVTSDDVAARTYSIVVGEAF